jgi:hypothetical protein
MILPTRVEDGVLHYVYGPNTADQTSDAEAGRHQRRSASDMSDGARVGQVTSRRMTKRVPTTEKARP